MILPFKKGYTPHNKGKKGYTNSGSFKKGRISSMKGKKYSTSLSDEERKKQHREHSKNYRKKYPEKIREWVEKNIESVRATKRKSAKKHPRADTPVMTKYRRSHRVCEWSYCDSTSVQVHHILPQFKYRDYIDGNYHGRIGNNFICYCPFHHFAYHFTYSTKRTAKKHQQFLPMLWVRVEQWANNNKISIEDLEIELAQML